MTHDCLSSVALALEYILLLFICRLFMYCCPSWDSEWITGVGLGLVCQVIDPLLLGVATPRDGWPELQLSFVRTTLFRSCCTSFRLYSTLIPLCSFTLFNFHCSNVQVLVITVLHQFHFSYSHSEWNLLFLQGEIVLALA